MTPATMKRARWSHGDAVFGLAFSRGFAGARVAQLVSRLLGRSGAINRPGGGGERWLSGQWRVNHPSVIFLLSNDNLRYHVSIIWKRSPARSHVHISATRIWRQSYLWAVIAESSRHSPFRRHAYEHPQICRSSFVYFVINDRVWSLVSVIGNSPTGIP